MLYFVLVYTGFTYDITGSYLTMYIIDGVLSLTAVVAMFVIYLYKSGRIGQKLPTEIVIDPPDDKVNFFSLL